MKTLISTLSALAIVASVFAGNGDVEKTTVKVNTAKSTLYWTGKKVTGSHTGTLGIKSGNIVIENGLPVSATVELDMTKIVCTDLTDAGTNEKLVGHLKSPDFFDVAKFPTGIFKATSFTPIAGAKDRDANYTAKGTLTLKGISHPIEFPVYVAVAGKTLSANGKATFDRAKYDIRFNSGSFFENLGDKTIYDDVEFNFILSAN